RDRGIRRPAGSFMAHSVPSLRRVGKRGPCSRIVNLALHERTAVGIVDLSRSERTTVGAVRLVIRGSANVPPNFRHTGTSSSRELVPGRIPRPFLPCLPPPGSAAAVAEPTCWLVVPTAHGAGRSEQGGLRRKSRTPGGGGLA